ncbi:Rpn family recombination-promoting nuclease/putative transposase [Pedobacter gandavensis]|uniref:Transposase (putative) YhgA-like domain-containing protein n=1 Tax=Pedobacter gandavensis TaxID=2679963 RepID=A0ABR6EXM2_9SPHI|nr:Rpn family recombination-promoting nuclease/putative transposase [Pedobacter gandavensis]MBB2149921.1 hypothetical protein [Pedobacter gandavensis]
MKPNDPRQGGMYDKILKENMEANLSGIVEQVLSLKITTSEEISDDLQHTKERKPDLLKKVQDETGRSYILHIEYQRQNDQNMAYRMAEYSVMLQRRYKLPVSQHMIYLGKEKLNMPTQIDTTNFKFSYDAKTISSIDYKLFLHHEVVEMKLLTILADLSEVDEKAVMKELVLEIQSVVVEELARGKYINQLKALAQLRDLGPTLENIMDEVANFYVEEKDPFFKRGEKKGEIKGERKALFKTVFKMKELGFPILSIVQITGLTPEEIHNISLSEKPQSL